MRHPIWFLSLLLSLSTLEAKGLTTDMFFEKPANTSSSNATYSLTYATEDTLPTTDDYLYLKVNSVSFFANSDCTGNERTLDLSNNNWWNSNIRFGGGASVNLGSLTLYSSAIDAAATALGYTLASNQCAEVEILYKNGTNNNQVGSNIVDMATGPAFNQPFKLSSITVNNGAITSGTVGNNALSIASKGNLEFYDGDTQIQQIRLSSATSKTITLKNAGYGDITNFSIANSTAFNDEFDNNTCNTTLSAGATCSITYSGATINGSGSLIATGTNNIQTPQALAFTVQKSGGVKCWGSNSNGQLGDNSTSQRTTPVDTSGLSSGVVAIASGENSTCALTSTGGVKCWGDNAFGQLGDSSTTQRLTPVDVSGMSSGIVAIASGADHVCALTSAGAVKCWGDNQYGQLGDGNGGSAGQKSTTPVDVSGLSSGVVAISAAKNQACVLLATGAIKCWGENSSGKLGDGTSTNRTAPVQVSGLTSGMMAIATGADQACALTDQGTVKCWGGNSQGQLGLTPGSPISSMIPVDADSSNLTSISSITSSLYNAHNCVITSSGAAKCWGWNNQGQLGNNTTTKSGSAVQVTDLTSGIIDITAGAAFSCAVSSSGSAKCWGQGNSGQLGNGTSGSGVKSLTPVGVTDLTSGALAISAGRSHACAIVAPE